MTDFMDFVPVAGDTTTMEYASFWNYLRLEDRDQTVAPFSALSLWWLLAALAPIGLMMLVIASAYTIAGGQDS